MIWFAIITLALAFAALFVVTMEMFSLRKRVAELEDQNSGNAMAAQSEILWEYKMAVAGLAGELIVQCGGGCPGHLGPKGDALVDEGLDKYSYLCEKLKEGFTS